MKVLAKLENVQLSESEDKAVWLQALPLNKYKHPVHGTIEITAERAKRFAENVKRKIRGTDLDIDYDHKLLRRDAAGWIVDAEARLSEPEPNRNGLWLLVKFTSEATQKLKDGAYKYFSSEYQDSWTDPITENTFEDVLFGGALTNRPYLRDIQPISLSELPINYEEVIAEEDNLQKGSNVEKLKEILSLPETATDDDVLETITALKSAAETAKKERDAKAPETGDHESGEGEGAEKELSELVKLSEDNPAIKLLLDERAVTRKELSELRSANRKSDVRLKLSELTNSENANYTLAPAVIESAKKFAERDDVSKELSDEMFAILGSVAKDGVVQLGELGVSKSDNGSTASKRLNDAIDKVMSDKSVDYQVALSEVVTKQPELYEAYSKELAEA